MKPLECVQRAGEVVFVPTGWHHAIINLEHSVGMAVEVGDSHLNEFDIGMGLRGDAVVPTDTFFTEYEGEQAAIQKNEDAFRKEQAEEEEAQNPGQKQETKAEPKQEKKPEPKQEKKAAPKKEPPKAVLANAYLYADFRAYFQVHDATMVFRDESPTDTDFQEFMDMNPAPAWQQFLREEFGAPIESVHSKKGTSSAPTMTPDEEGEADDLDEL
jgi:hypothetical protein